MVPFAYCHDFLRSPKPPFCVRHVVQYLDICFFSLKFCHTKTLNQSKKSVSTVKPAVTAVEQ